MKSQGLEWSWKGGCEEMGVYLAVIINNLISVTRRNSPFFYTSPYLKKKKWRIAKALSLISILI